MNEYTKQVLHLTRMAMLPGFLDHARLRRRELEEDPMFKGIGQAVKAEIERHNHEDKTPTTESA